MQVQGDAYFLEFRVVGQFRALRGFRFPCRRGPTAVDDEAIEKGAEEVVGAVLRTFVAFASHKCVCLFDGHGFAGQGENGDHVLVGEVQSVAQSTQGIVVVRGVSGWMVPAA